MDQLRFARDRLERASDVPAILEAACTAFEDMLVMIQTWQDQLGPAFAAFMLAGASAANGRFTVIAAPSLPRHAAAATVNAGGDRGPDLSAEDAGVALAGLGQLLATRLDQAATWAADPADRDACADAARHARAVCARLGAPSPR